MMAMAMATSSVATLAPQTTRIRISAGVNGLLSLGFGKRAPIATWSTGQQCRGAAAAQGDGATAAAGGRSLQWREAAAKDVGLFGGLREKSMFSVLSYLEDCSLGGEGEKLEGIAAGIIGAALILLFSFAAIVPPSTAAAITAPSTTVAPPTVDPPAIIPPTVAAETTDLRPYFGTASSASSYGGYGGNSNKQTTAEYTFNVPEGWKEKTITKIEKGTNGTDAEFGNPKHKEEKVYVTYLANFRQLAPIDKVLDNLALSDPVLQNIIAYADGNIKSVDRKDSSGQQYYDYEIDSPVANVLVSVTCAKNKLYAHFVKAGPSDWARDQNMLRRLHESFQTVGAAPLGY